ncbi:MAG TPA: endonuclease III [Anaerolineae bacterium]|nr:endonuclease III [Anaerolineae bacterium]
MNPSDPVQGSNSFKAPLIHKLLLQEYGPRPWQPGRDPLATLVSTILSQNTNDLNRDRAFEQMRKRFPTWEEVRDADPAELVEAIRPAGLANQKGPRIQNALRIITEQQSELSLDFLADMEIEEARKWLTSIKGVGPKTAAIVLCFAFGKPAFPVDTHVHRVTRRLGLIGPKTTREQAHALLERLLPAEIYYSFHISLIAHGRQVCKSQRPRCESCVLQEHCDYFAARLTEAGEKETL